MRKEIKKYSDDLLTIRNLVNNWDPVGLITGGAPDNEYDDVTERLLSMLYNRDATQELETFLFTVFNTNYGFTVGIASIRRFIETLASCEYLRKE